MLPPWEQHPTFQLGSMVWRMGVGEEYWYAFQDWFTTLETGERAEFERRWPEPEGWGGFYNRTLEHKARR